MIKAAHPSFGGQDAKLDGAGEVGIQAFVQHTADKPACKGVPGAGVIVQLVLIELLWRTVRILHLPSSKLRISWRSSCFMMSVRSGEGLMAEK